MSVQATSAPVKHRGIFCGWYIMAAAMVNQIVLSSLGGQGFGTFILPLQEAFGWSKGALSAAQSFTQIEGGLLDPIQGMVVDRIGPRIMVVSGMTLF